MAAFGVWLQPVCGILSDRSRCRIGRRRPFILSFLTLICCGFAIVMSVVAFPSPSALSGVATCYPLSHSSAFLIAHSGLGLKLQPSWTPIQLLCSSLLCSLATGNRLPQSRVFRAPAVVASVTQPTTPTHSSPSQPHGSARRLVSYAQSIAARGFCGTPSAGAGEWHLVWRLQPGPMRRAAPHWRSTA